MRISKYSILILLMFFFSCKTEKKNIIVFYSQSGNTEKLALEIYNHRPNADTLSIQLKDKYPNDFQGTIERCKSEIADDILPELSNGKIDLQKYDTIFLGYPIWFGTFARPIKSFIVQNDSLKGHVIIPFATYGRRGFNNSIEDLTAICQSSTVKNGIGLSSKSLHRVREIVNNYFERSEGICGGFSQEQELSDEDITLFNLVVDKNLGLTPLSVSSQVVAGMNYIFMCTDSKGKDVSVKIFKPLPGRGEPELVQIGN